MSTSNISVGTKARLIKRAFAAHYEARRELEWLILIGRKNGWPMPWQPGFKERFGIDPMPPRRNAESAKIFSL